ncbi:hypothetical protein F52700_6646 [Fusarium sp. NRRL 52700]|nr:hypothetical protein F52700_6646 [Fusarium sp. NRRL 52700]
MEWHTLYRLIYPEDETPRTHLVEITVPYLTAKTGATLDSSGDLIVKLDNVYVRLRATGSQAVKEYLSKTDPRAQSQEQRVALPALRTLAPHPTQHAPQPQASPLQPAQSSHQHQQQPQQPRAVPALYNSTQTSSYQQSPFSDPLQPGMTPVGISSMPPGSTSQQGPQPQEHSTTNELSTLNDPSRINPISAVNASTRTGSIGQPNLEPRPEEDPIEVWPRYDTHFTKQLDEP